MDTTAEMPGGEPTREAEPTATPSGGQTGGAEPRSAQASSRPRLVRPARNRQIAGVAAGIGAHFNVDPVIIRVAFVILAFAGGVGVPLYLAGWLLIPKEGETQSLGEGFIEWARQSPLWMVVLLLIAGVLVIGSFDPWNSWAALWAVLLVAAGIWLYRWDIEGRPARQGAGVKEGPSTPIPAGVPSPAPTKPAANQATSWQTSRTAAQAARGAPPISRPRSYLGRYTFAAILIVLGMMAILDNTGALNAEAGDYPAVALLVTGLGLVVGSLWGRSRGMILVGLLLIPCAYLGAMIDLPLRGETGQQFYAPRSVAELRDEYRLLAGEMTLDLTRMQWGAEPVEIDTSVAFGEILVFVPDNVKVDFRGHANAGELQLFDMSRGGIDVDLHSAERVDEGEPLLILDSKASFGAVEVVRTSSPGEVSR